MQAKATLSAFGRPVPELPVRDVERAQAHYRDKFGFQVGWLYPGEEIGAVNRDETAIFFRRRSGAFEPAVHWVYAPDIETMYQEMRACRCKHHRAAGKEALGPHAIHRRGSRRQSLLLPPGLT